MKKLTKTFCITTLFLTLLNANPMAAQGTRGSDDHCFDENTKILNVGVGFGPAYYNYTRGKEYKYRRTPALNVSYEQAFPKKLGIGYLGLGGYLGFQHASLRYDGSYYAGNSYYYKHNWNYFVIAARGVYHFDVVNWKNGELYAGVLIGLRIQTYNYETNDVSPYNYELNEGSVYPTFSFFAGARWYFAKRIALYGEVGSGVSYITGGLSFKF